jgi:hypothetical protein
MGNNPNLKGKRGKGNPEALRKYREQQAEIKNQDAISKDTETDSFTVHCKEP